MAKKTSGRQVNTIDPEEAAKKIGGTRSEFLNIEDDTEYDIRILPPFGNGLDGRPLKTPWIEHQTHSKFIDGKYSGFTVEDGPNRMLHCLAFHGDGQCPACALMEYCEAEGEDAGWLKAKSRYLMNVVCDGELRILDAAPSIVKAVQKYVSNKKYGVTLFDEKRGRNFTVIRTKNRKTGFREYAVTPDPDASAVAIPDWMDQAADLTKLVSIIPQQEMTDILVANLTGVLPVAEALNVKVKSAPKTTKKGGKKAKGRK